MLVNIFIQKPHHSSFFEAIFFIQTIDDVYYCNIFFNEARPDKIVIFENFLKSHAIEYEVYIENQSNTDKYQIAWDVEWQIYRTVEGDLPLYSYWH